MNVLSASDGWELKRRKLAQSFIYATDAWELVESAEAVLKIA